MKFFWLLMGVCLLGGTPAATQRSYRSNAVLSSGIWYKIGVTGPGIYKLDVAFLSKLGLSTASLSTASIRLYGNGGGMLPENPGEWVPDDLREVALWPEDGGDGVLNGADYLIFYAPGPHQWVNDTVNRQFQFRKNLYSDTAYYFLTTGGNGKRITPFIPPVNPDRTVTAYDLTLHHELDTFNLLSSGKQWFGEEFSTLPGGSLSRTIRIALPGEGPHALQCQLHAVGRTFASGSAFSLKNGGQPWLEIAVPPVGTGPYDLFAQDVAGITAPTTFSGSEVSLTLQFTPAGAGGQAWLDWLQIHGRSPLRFAAGRPFFFRDRTSVSPGSAALFRVTAATASLRIWDVSQPDEPISMPLTKDGNDWTFVNNVSVLREYAGFGTEAFSLPVALGRMTNQNLHALSAAPLLIITTPALRAQANRLAAYHLQRDGMKSVVVNAQEVFNEFASGIPDPVAIRDFVKMFYDRADGDSLLRPRYLLLFGAASFDYKNRIARNTNLVPAYESMQSLDPLTTYTSDDFFGMLDDGDDINGTGTPLLDIGIGRIPAATVAEATAYVNKVLAYHDTSALGEWRTAVTFIADDEDNNLHLQDAETLTGKLQALAAAFSVHKIYLDAYRQESGVGGSRYPGASTDILTAVNEGTLIWNYSGHGGYRRLAEEVVLDQEVIRTFSNEKRWPLFITATCDVAPYDNPLVLSIGEALLLRPQTGAIALMTTTRLVFAFSNRVMNENYLAAAFRRTGNGTYPSLGEAVRVAKNTTYAFYGDAVNNRKFTLLGDPALTLAFPQYNVRVASVNGRPSSSLPDTLNAFSRCTIGGEVVTSAGTLLDGFNGTVYARIFDKPVTRFTLGNDPGSPVTSFNEQVAPIFRGAATVRQGRFTLSFVVPRDIDYRFGNGKAVFYADNGQTDGSGVSTNIIIGGSGAAPTDKEGPHIQAWFNDERFTQGSLTNARPILLVRLEDSSGINISGAALGHEITAVLDGDPRKTIVLNRFYEADKDNYRAGRIRFTMPRIARGPHTLTIKAWDAVNNAAQYDLTFRVEEEERLTLENVVNYPNPFTTNTSFWFDHNRAGETLQVSIQLFTVSGKLVKTIREAIFSEGGRSNEIRWDGRDDFGNRLGRGTYIYHLKVTSADGKNAEQWQKLYLL